MVERRHIAFPGSFDVPDCLHPGGIDWRKVRISIDLDKMSWLTLRIRRKSGGRSSSELFSSGAWRGTIDDILSDILRRSGNDLLPPASQHPILDAPAGGTSDNPGRSPSMSFRLRDGVADRLKALSAHERVRLLRIAAAAARESADRRSSGAR